MTNSSTNQMANTSEQILSDTLSEQNMPKKYSLVKWLENSQFDVNNEWLGRLTSVPHSNIIDLDIDELKVGMEISVFRNCGEIWRAQVVIPKTASNTIDLPPNSQQQQQQQRKAKTKPQKFSDARDQIQHSPTNFLNDFEDRTPTTPLLNPTLMLLTTPTSLTSPGLELTQTSKLKTELQYLQKAINDAGLNDFYQTSHTQISDPLANLTNQSPLLSSTCLKPSYNFMTSSSDTCVENVLKIQNELLEQQKELKSIELETLEQLKLLQQNLNRLAKKFDSFESVILNSSSNAHIHHHPHLTSGLINTNFLTTTSNLKMTKTNIANKLNGSIQQIKVVK